MRWHRRRWRARTPPSASSRPERRPGLNTTDRRIISLAIPALGSLAVEPLYVLVDTAIVGRLGTPQLGGLALSATVLTLVVGLCMFLVYGTTEQVARRVGAGRPAEAAEVGVQALWLGVFVSVPVALVVGVAARPLARALGGSDAVVGFATTYLQVSAIGLPAVVFMMCAQGVQRGVSDYRTPMIILLTSNAVNAGLEVLFVFGLGWGVPGSAWSTVIAQVAAASVFVVVVRRHLRLAASRRPNWARMKPLASAGRHLVLRSLSMLVVFIGTTSIASRTDDPTLAAHQVVAGLLSLVALMLDALAIPAQTMVAEALGRDDRTTAAYVNRRVVRLSIWCAIALGALIAALAPVLPALFTGDGAVASRATAALVVLGLGVLVPAGVAFGTDGTLIGAGDYRFLARAAMAYLVLSVPLGALVLELQGGIVAIWLVFAFWMMLRALTNTWRVRQLLA